MKLDPYKHKERFLKWKQKIQENGIENISKISSEYVLNYISDMESGLNVAISHKKGARSYPRLNNIKQRMIFLVRKFEELYDIKDISKISEKQLFSFFTGMRNGEIRTLQGKVYKSTGDYVNIFKAFWHWHMKVMKKQDIEIKDITADLDTSTEKPKWVYLNEEEIKKLAENATYNHRVLIWFLFDTGIRAPTELMNIKVSDLHDNCKELIIREETSKTFGRRIKLMLCSDYLREYIKIKNLNSEDFLFTITPGGFNLYLKRLAKRILGEDKTLAGQRYNDLSMYDFRHCSCCYWVNRYKSESALKFRFGWKSSDKIHYYSEFLGMKDNITEEDLLVDVTKTEIEQRLTKSENQNQILRERLMIMESQMQNIIGEVKATRCMIVRN